jgi:large subunit ribosomal protein L6
MSRIGKAPIPVPAGVDVTVTDARHGEGPQGHPRAREIPGDITITQEGDTLLVRAPRTTSARPAMHGLTRRW